MELGQVISGKYRLLRLLGDGGMGAVYEAHHEVLGSSVAVKVLHEDLAKKPELVDRFLREARVLAQLKNPHVVRVLDIAMADAGSPAYIVMELLAGEPLSALLRRERRVPLPTAIEYASQVLDALAAAHALGVVHRDLKPENVFVTREGEHTVLKVIDFGIAKAGALGGAPANLTISGALMGTPEYMAPEQAHSADRADARSDIFAVGVLLYEMIAGARPVDGDDPRAVAMKVERGEVHPLIHRVPEIPRELAGLVHRAMAARPELRFATAVEMRAALSTVLGGKQASTAPPPSSASATASVRAGAGVVSPPEPSRGTGTLFGAGEEAPAPQLLPSARDMTPTVAGGGRRGPDGIGVAPAVRGRRRSGGGTVWLLVSLAVLLGGGFALAFAFTGSSKKQPTTVVRTTPTAVDSQTELPTTPSPEVSLDPSLGPLPGPRTTTPRSIVSPTPHTSSSTAPNPSASAPHPTPDTPFGVPPFSFPSGLPNFPNPFPNPGGSGVGPVFTIPTTFAPFGFPPAPAPAAPAPSAPSPSPSPAASHSAH